TAAPRPSRRHVLLQTRRGRRASAAASVRTSTMRIGQPVVILPLLRMAIAVYSARSAVPEHRASALDWSALPRAIVTADTRRNELAIELPPVDLPAGSGHHGPQPPACAGEFPVSGAIYQFHAEVVDENGRRLPT